MSEESGKIKKGSSKKRRIDESPGKRQVKLSNILPKSKFTKDSKSRNKSVTKKKDGLDMNDQHDIDVINSANNFERFSNQVRTFTTRNISGIGDISVMDCINSSRCPKLFKVFVSFLNPRKENDGFMNLISKEEGSLHVYQCLFCPFIAKVAQDVSTHMGSVHSELAFAVNQSKVKVPVLFFCRHCNFVSADSLVLWIHFEVFHGIQNILSSDSNETLTTTVVKDDATNLSLDVKSHYPMSYICLECTMLTSEKQAVVTHIRAKHCNTTNCNGCFVKAVEICRPKNALRLPVPTYRQLLMDATYSLNRRFCFICTICFFVAYDPRLALSHRLFSHQDMKLVFACIEPGCVEMFSNEQNLLEHSRTVHQPPAGDHCIFCSVTIVKPKDDEQGYSECCQIQNKH